VTELVGNRVALRALELADLLDGSVDPGGQLTTRVRPSSVVASRSADTTP
jgi:hypothetical protein